MALLLLRAKSLAIISFPVASPPSTTRPRPLNWSKTWRATLPQFKAKCIRTGRKSTIKNPNHLEKKKGFESQIRIFWFKKNGWLKFIESRILPVKEGSEKSIIPKRIFDSNTILVVFFGSESRIHCVGKGFESQILIQNHWIRILPSPDGCRMNQFPTFDSFEISHVCPLLVPFELGL